MKRISLALAATLLSGAASAQTLTATTITQYQGVPLTTISYEQPDFVATTAAKAAFGIFGALSMISEGRRIAHDEQLADPAVVIADKLGAALADAFKASANTRLTGKNDDDDSARDISKIAEGKGLAFAVETRGWQITYFAFDWTHYRVVYSARARLADAATGTLLSESSCNYSSGDDQPTLSYDDMMANGAAQLKAKLQAATEQCTAQFERDILAVAATAPPAAGAPPVPAPTAAAPPAPAPAPTPTP